MSLDGNDEADVVRKRARTGSTREPRTLSSHDSSVENGAVGDDESVMARLVASVAQLSSLEGLRNADEEGTSDNAEQSSGYDGGGGVDGGDFPAAAAPQDAASEEDVMDVESAMQTVSVSSLSMYFNVDCDRYLRLLTMSKQSVVDAGFARPLNHGSAATTESQTSRGKSFEAEILQDRLSGCAGLTLRNMCNKRAAFVRHVFDELTGNVCLYQSSLAVPGRRALLHTAPYLASLRRHGLAFASFAPDFLFTVPRDDELHLFIVDAKSSANVKLAHLVQVALYSLLIEAYLEEAGVNERRAARRLPRIVVSKSGGIWTPMNTANVKLSNEVTLERGPSVHNMTLVREKLLSFLTHELPLTLQRSVANVEWRLSATCRSVRAFVCACLCECVRKYKKVHVYHSYLYSLCLLCLKVLFVFAHLSR